MTFDLRQSGFWHDNFRLHKLLDVLAFVCVIAMLYLYHYTDMLYHYTYSM